MRWAILAIAGAIVCTVCDHLHVITGVLAYPRPFLWQQAWWVPFLFAAASLFVVAAARPILVAFGGADDRPPAAREVAGDGIQFVTAYAFTAYGHTLPSVVLAVLVAWWLGRVVRGRRFWLVPYSFAAAAGGTLFEAGLSSTGAFHYLVPDFLGVPMWLPALYLHVALLSGPLHVLVARRSE